MATQTRDVVRVGDNVNIERDGDELVIRVNLSTTVGMSSSGKMMGIANTGGFQSLPGESPRGKMMKLNLYLGER